MDSLSTYLGGILAILLLTSFVKMLTTLTILRVGVGLNQSGFGIVIIAVSLALSLIIMSPQLADVGGLNGLLRGQASVAAVDYDQKFRPFLERHGNPELSKRLQNITLKASTVSDNESVFKAENAAPAAEEKPVGKEVNAKVPLEILVGSFLLTELKEAFQLGAIILIPFLIIDLLIANILMLLGATQVSPELVSLPLKIILFFAVDGWTLIAEKLLRAYA